jgi:S-adenosylmethionine:tRNA ribosyltransferase-isomerase
MSLPPARAPRAQRDRGQLLVIDASRERVDISPLQGIERWLGEGDLLVFNDSATLPASLSGTAGGRSIEVRLLAAPEAGRADAVLFGEGDWRMLTEHRPAPPTLAVGDALRFHGLEATITGVSPRNPRLVSLRFDVPEDLLWPALYRAGRPVQYSYLEQPLALWTAQTVYGSRPWSAETPSAGWPFTFSLLAKLTTRGVREATLTHAAGLSSTGDPSLDALLPLPERFEIPETTVEAIRIARRVIAVGTSVVRALEGAAAAWGALRPGGGITDLRIGPDHALRVVDGLFTGMHDGTSSHFDLLSAFAPRRVLDAAYARAAEAHFLAHELGDSTLIL